MHSTTFNKLRVNMAEQFKESVSEPSPNTQIYLVYGKVDAWANDSSPDIATSTVTSEYDLWRNMIGGKKITGNDMQHIIPRYNWNTGTSYIAYDDNSPNLQNGSPFYVLTSSNRVYKCLSNNYSSVSTVEPTAVNPLSTTNTADGYRWKYMYTVSDSDLLRFTTTDYIPVKTLSSDDGSDQWVVQTNATQEIDSIIVISGGSNYTNANSISVSVITGDGSGLAATARINTVSQTVANVTITNPGTGYTYATVSITGGDGAGATARAIISPIGGHGSNPLYELGGSYVLINPRLKADENGILPVSNDYRQIGLIKDPYLRGTNAIASNTVFLQAYTITTTGSGDYLQDEIVYQGTSYASSTFSAKVLSWNSSIGTLTVINRVGTLVSGIPLYGATSSTVRYITSIETGDFQDYSGQVLYIDNIKPITRAADQTEDFKIIVKF